MLLADFAHKPRLLRLPEGEFATKLPPTPTSQVHDSLDSFRRALTLWFVPLFLSFYRYPSRNTRTFESEFSMGSRMRTDSRPYNNFLIPVFGHWYYLRGTCSLLVFELIVSFVFCFLLERLVHRQIISESREMPLVRSRSKQTSTGERRLNGSFYPTPACPPLSAKETSGS